MQPNNELNTEDKLTYSLTGIACVDKNNGLGYKNDLIIRDKKDLQQFKQITKNGVLVMGRKTHESINGGKALPTRTHIVLTTQQNLSYGTNVIVVNSIEEVLLLLTNEYTENNKFVIGGGEIYSLFAPYLTDFYLTKANYAVDNVDTYLNEIVLATMKEHRGKEIVLTNTLTQHYYTK